MEFIERNFINTTGAITVDSNTTTVKNIFNWDLRFQYSSDGYNDDTTSTTLTVSFDNTTSIDRIAIMEHNLKDFSLYYDGTTTNLFSFTSTASTNTSSFTSNSETAQYFRCTSVDCTSVSIKMNATQVANSEKAIGLFILSALKYDFARIPAANGYKPRREPKQVIHRMSDGGRRQHKLNDKWRVDLKFTDIDVTQRNNFKTIYDDTTSYVFTAFGTSTAWDEVIFDSIWENSFEFYQYSENSTTQNFKGNIKLRERS